MTIRILVTGSRLLPATGLVAANLDQIEATLGPDLLIVHGKCDPRDPATARPIPWAAAVRREDADRLLGADWQADRWALGRRHRIERHPAHWSLGRSAGPIRNQLLADLGGRTLLAFPHGRSAGTWDAVRRAKAAGIPVRVVERGGEQP